MSGKELFDNWMTTEGVKGSEVAGMLACDRTHIFRLRSGQRLPGLAMGLAIEKLTEGKVPAASWVPDLTAAGMSEPSDSAPADAEPQGAVQTDAAA